MIEMLDLPGTAPFTAALLLMLMLAAVEVAGLFFGASASAAIDTAMPDMDVDMDVDVDAGADLGAAGDMAAQGALVRALAWLSFGKAPALALLIAFLTAFGLVGLLLQGALNAVAGLTAPAVVAAVPALAAGGFAMRAFGRLFIRYMPGEETDAVSRDAYVGKLATVIRGEARSGLPVEAKIEDLGGTTHYVLIEPDSPDERIAAPQRVLIVRQVEGRCFATADFPSSMADDAPSK